MPGDMEGRAVHRPTGKAPKLMQIEGTPETREVGDVPGERQDSTFPSHFLSQLTPSGVTHPACSAEANVLSYPNLSLLHMGTFEAA